MVNELQKHNDRLIACMLRMTAEWQSHDTNSANVADKVALYLLCGAGLLEMRMRGRAWGEQSALDFEAITVGVWVDIDRKSILPDEIRNAVPAWARQRVAVQLNPIIESRLSEFGTKTRTEIVPGKEFLFASFVALNPIRGRVIVRLLGNEGPSPGAPQQDSLEGGIVAELRGIKEALQSQKTSPQQPSGNNEARRRKGVQRKAGRRGPSEQVMQIRKSLHQMYHGGKTYETIASECKHLKLSASEIKRHVKAHAQFLRRNKDRAHRKM